VLARYWRRAGSLLEVADQADHEGAKVKRRGRDARGVSARARVAWRQAEQAFDKAFSVEAAWISSAYSGSAVVLAMANGARHVPTNY
jgi:hypothetical protein